MTTDTPQHPGEELWADYLEPLNLTVGQAAKALGVTRKTVSLLINGRQGISPEMSVRLGKALNTAPDTWAAKQWAFDISQVDHKRLSVKRLVPRHFDGDPTPMTEAERRRDHTELDRLKPEWRRQRAAGRRR